jgi:hypothetical protein
MMFFALACWRTIGCVDRREEIQQRDNAEESE